MFIPRKFKTHKLVLYLFAFELPFIVVILILTGIASHNTYSGKLWLDGNMNGFNSAPNQIVYALTNGKSYTTPIIWSTFLQSYNLVIGVLAVFIHLTKGPMHVLRIFYPPLSAFIHGALTALFVASVVLQAGPDMTDSNHPQPGPPWYITKSCSVAYYSSNVGYCQQAKSLFAICVIVSVVYFVQFILAIRSCFSTKEEREAYRLRKEEKKEEQAAEERALREYEEILKSPTYGMGMPMTPASGFPGMHPMPMTPHSPMMGGSPRMVSPGMFQPGMGSPRIQEFYQAKPSNDLPFRTNNFSMPMNFQSTRLTTTEVSPEAPVASGAVAHTPPQGVQTYFPPPPKSVTK